MVHASFASMQCMSLPAVRALINNLDPQRNRTIHMVLGPGCSSGATAVAPLANAWNLTTVSNWHTMSGGGGEGGGGGVGGGRGGGVGGGTGIPCQWGGGRWECGGSVGEDGGVWGGECVEFLLDLRKH